MKMICDSTGIRVMPSIRMFSALTLALSLLLLCAPAPAQDSKPDEAKVDTEIYQTIYLANVRDQSELTEISTALRNMLAHTKIYSSSSQDAISIRGSAEDIQLAQKIVADLDRAKKAYRLTYTLTDIDGGKRGGTQSFSLVVASGERATLKQGSRVPIMTGSYDTASSNANTQIQYLDVGLGIQASPNAYADGLHLSSKIEQSSVADQKPSASPQDPVLNQIVLEATSNLVPDKPQVLGSIENPVTSHRQEVAVTAELVK
jgi:type II secretory pathway component GspD/PulD (secretin)